MPSSQHHVCLRSLQNCICNLRCSCAEPPPMTSCSLCWTNVELIPVLLKKMHANAFYYAVAVLRSHPGLPAACTGPDGCYMELEQGGTVQHAAVDDVSVHAQRQHHQHQTSASNRSTSAGLLLHTISVPFWLHTAGEYCCYCQQRQCVFSGMGMWVQHVEGH